MNVQKTPTVFDRIEAWLDKQIELLTSKIKKWVNTIKINGGESHFVVGRNIIVRKDKIFVDNTLIEEGLTGTVKIEFTGDLATLNCTESVINGNVRGDVDATSIVVNGNVNGDVDGTTVKCGNVGGDVDGTSVTCGKVKGDVDATTLKKIRK